MNFRICRVVWMAAWLAAAARGHAQTSVWTWATGDWLTPGNWDHGVPDSGTSAIIENGTATLSGMGSAGTLTLGDQSAGTLVLSGTTANRGVLTTGQISRATVGGTLHFDGGVLRPTADRSEFLAGFEAGDVQLLGGGAFIDTHGHTVGIGAVLQGAGGLTKQGQGTLTLSGENTFAGLTTIEAGTLALGHSRALQSSTLNYLTTGGTLSFGSLTSATFGGLSGDRGLELGNVALTVGGNNADTTYQGTISGTGATLIKTGTGTLTLSGANTHTGGTVIRNGTLAVTAGGLTYPSGNFVIGQESGDNASFTLTGGSIMNYMAKIGAAPGSVGTATITGGIWEAQASVSVGYEGIGTLTIADHGVVNADIFVGRSGGTLNLNGTAAGRGVLNTGAITFLGYATPTTIATVNFNGGIVRLTGNTAFFLNGFSAGELHVLEGGAFFDTNGHTVEISSALPGEGGLTKQGAGILRLSGDNTYLGATTVEAGILELTGHNLYAGGTALQAGTRVVISDNRNLGAATGGLTFNGGILASTADLTMNRLTLLQAGGGQFSVKTGTQLTQQGVIQGTGALTKIGGGNLMLSGANTYTGNTVVSAGTLTLDADSSIASSAMVELATGTALNFAGPSYTLGAVNNAGTISVANGQSVTVEGAMNNSMALAVTGTLTLKGGGASTGFISLTNGGNLVFDGGTFTLGNAGTRVSGTGGFTFASGTTTLDYGVTNAPVTSGQFFRFAGGSLTLPGATALRTSGLGLLGGDTLSDLPTTVTTGGQFVWAGGIVRNTLTLEAGVTAAGSLSGLQVTTPVVPSRSGSLANRIEGTLVNRSATLRFESDGLGDFGGSGTLRNEGTVYVEARSNWSPTIENTGTATLGGAFLGPVNNAGSMLLLGNTTVTNLTQSAGSTSVLAQTLALGQTWSVQGGSFAAPSGGYVEIGTFNNAGTVSVGGSLVLAATVNNLAGGVFHVSAPLITSVSLLTQNAGTIILDGPSAALLRVGTTRTQGKLGSSGVALALANVAAGTVEVRNGNSFAVDGLSGPVSIAAGPGGILTWNGGTVDGPGELDVRSGGTMKIVGGVWGAREIRNAGTINVNDAEGIRPADGTAAVFNNLADGVINLNNSYNFINATGNRSATVTNAAGATIRKGADRGGYELLAGNGTFLNYGLVDVPSGTGKLAVYNFTNAGTIRAAAGTEIRLRDGTLLAGSALEGPGAYLVGNGGTLTLGAGYSFSAINFELSDGDLTGAGDLRIASGNTFKFYGGTITGSGRFDLLAGGTVINNGGGIWGARAIRNEGTFSVDGALRFTDGTAVVFENLAGGVVRLTNPYQFLNVPTNGSLTLTNAAGATIRKATDQGAYDLVNGNGTFMNYGLVDLPSGTGKLGLNNFTNAGTIRTGVGTEIWLGTGTLLAGSTLEGPGAYFMANGGTLTLSAGFNLAVADYRLSNGDVTGAGNIRIGSGSTFEFSGGTVSGSGRFDILAGGTVNANGGGTWGPRAIRNEGTFNVTGALQFTDGTAGVFNNLAGAVVNLSNSYQFLFVPGNQSVTLTNAAGATIRRVSGVGDYDLISGNGTFVNEGTLEVNAGTLRATVALPGGELTQGTWRVTDGAWLSLNGDAPITRNAATVVLTGATSRFEGLNGLVGNSGSLSLLGGRTFTTSAAFTNTGTLTVGPGSSFTTTSTFTNSGILNITGGFSAGGGLVVTGTLGGSGTISAHTTLANGGTLSPGNSPGTLTFSAGLTLQAGSILDLQLGTASDLIVVSGGLLTGPASGTVILNFSNAGGFAAGTYPLINYASASGTNNFEVQDFAFGNTLPGYTYGLAINGNALQLTASAIPEPSTYAALAGAVALAGAAWRRRREVPRDAPLP